MDCCQRVIDQRGTSLKSPLSKRGELRDWAGQWFHLIKVLAWVREFRVSNDVYKIIGGWWGVGLALFSRISRFLDSDFHIILLHARVAAHPAMVFAFLSAVCLSPLFHKRLQQFICSTSQARFFFKVSSSKPRIDIWNFQSRSQSMIFVFLNHMI